MKRLLLVLFLFGLAGNVAGQLKVGNNVTNLHPDVLLELESSNRGFRLPRVQLDSTLLPAPMSSFVEGVMVYNLTAVHDVVEGLYYCDGSKWIPLRSGTSGGWTIGGNGGTTPGSDFLGTTDSTDLTFKTNGTERMRVKADGNIGIGTANPQSRLHINGDLSIDSVASGNLATDSIMVLSASDHKVRMVSPVALKPKVQKLVTSVVLTGQTNFNTPSPITDSNSVFLYRNGVLIGFTVVGASTITAEIPCVTGDEIKIVQIE